MRVDGGFTRDYAITAMKKDIETKVAIFDLIDNSINAAENLDRIREHKIIIYTDSEHFYIEDDCGGINPKLIKDVFKIGTNDNKGNGFGVEMKRAIIKLGNKAKIFSYNRYKSVYVDFDVSKWGYNNDWSLNVQALDEPKDNKYGLKIYIEDLNEEVKRYFIKNENSLRESISRRYRMILDSGMKIILNGKDINAYRIKEKPNRISPKYAIGKDIRVQVRLYSSINTFEENGWDIFVNKRCILERNKSRSIKWYKTKQETGYSYRRFIGEVLIEGNNVNTIPLNSTKDKIDFDSEVMDKIMRIMYDYLFKNKDIFKKKDVIIQFSREIEEVDILKDYFDEKTAKATGQRSFDKVLGIAYKLIDKEKM